MAPHPEVNPEALRAIMSKDGYTVSSFARAIEMAPSHLSNILAGRRGCKPHYVKKMAEVLVVPISALLWRKDNDEAA